METLFNKDAKERYLSGIKNSSTAKNVKSFFSSVAPIEFALGKDIVYFTNEELATHFTEIQMCNLDTVKTNISWLRKYRYWFNDNVERCKVRTNTEEIIELIDCSETAKNKNTFVFSMNELLSIIDRGGHLDGRAHAPMFILAWYGLHKPECYPIKKEDVVELENGNLEIKTKNKILVIDHPRCVEILKEYKNLRSIVRKKNPLYQANDVFLLRKFVTEKSLPDEAVQVGDGIFTGGRDIYKKAVDEKPLTYTDVRISGEMWRLFQAELAGENLRDVIIREHGADKIDKIGERIALYEAYKKLI